MSRDYIQFDIIPLKVYKSFSQADNFVKNYSIDDRINYLMQAASVSKSQHLSNKFINEKIYYGQSLLDIYIFFH